MRFITSDRKYGFVVVQFDSKTLGQGVREEILPHYNRQHI